MCVIVVCVVCVVLFYGSYSIKNSFYLKSLCRSKDSLDCVAITFDDGVDPVTTPKVLDVLSKYDVKATFFIIGQKASQYPQIVKQIADQGHTIGNHSHYHRGYFPIKSSAAIGREIELCSETLKRITGRDVKLFRPPFGVTNPMVGRAVRRSALISIGWTVRSLDTMGGDKSRICNRVVRKLKAGDVVLLHDRIAGADSLLDAILSEMSGKGLKAVTIDKLFDIKQT